MSVTGAASAAVTARLARIRHSKGYESVSRAMAQDSTISPKALGILVYLLSLPEGWNTNIARIAKERGVGKDYVATALQELQKAGYLFRKRRHIGGGKWDWLWLYSDDPEALAEQVRELCAGTFDPDQLAAFAVPAGADGTSSTHDGPPDPADDDALFSQVEAMTGKSGDGPTTVEEPPGGAITGFPGHGNPSAGKPVAGQPGDKEIHSVERPPTPTARPGSRGQGSAPASGSPETPPRCDHGLLSCRPCGTSPRAQRAAQQLAAEQTEAEQTRRCPMCSPTGQRWDPEAHFPLTPYVRCDHTTPHAVVVEQQRQADLADIAARPTTPAEPVRVITRPMRPSPRRGASRS